MKKVILTALAIATLQFAWAQNTQTSSNTQSVEKKTTTPEQLANRQSAHLQKVLTLTDEQKQKVYQAAVTRATAIQQIKSKSTTENRKELHAETKPVKEQFVKDVNATLTPEQQKKWNEYRLQQKQKIQERRNQQTAPVNGTSTTPAATPTKLEPADDGMRD